MPPQLYLIAPATLAPRQAAEQVSAVLEAASFAALLVERVSFDDAGYAELAEALTMAADHLSLYQLTIEDGTAFGARYAAGKLAGLPEDDVAADMYFATQEMCGAAGFATYEVSNHARPGQESRHNLVYWQSGDYAGIGPGAHGRLTQGGTRWATAAQMAPTAWLQQVESAGTGEMPREALTAEERLAEFVLMGLRLADGIALDRFEALGGGDYMKNIKRLIDSGNLLTEHGMVRVAPDYRPVLNAVLREVLAD